MRLSALPPVCLATLVVLFSEPADGQNSAPTVSNVQASQRPGTGWVDIHYDVADPDGDMVTARVICSTDGGATFNLFVQSATGDGLDGPVPPGPGKHIEWNAAQDYPGRYWANVIAKVIATDGAATGGEMVLVPAGEFTMGKTNESDSQPVHMVSLDAFYIDKFEVTNGEFQVFMDADGYTTAAYWSPEGWAWRTANNITRPDNWGTGTCNTGSSYPGFPVQGVSWYEAEAYAHFIGKRLPTEAEWEKAARGADQRDYPWGGDLASSRANYWQSGDPFEYCTTPVGFFDGRLHPSPAFQTIDSAGPYGAYDQSGNVVEWVNDWYDATYYSGSPGSNPPGPATGTAKVLRGGSAERYSSTNGSYMLTTWHRFHKEPDEQWYYTFGSFPATGFRCARSAQ